MHVLIAEDEAVMRTMLQQFLKHWGHSVSAAADGEEAWTLLNQQPERPQLAMLDWMMPRLAGPELCRRIRSSDDTRST